MRQTVVNFKQVRGTDPIVPAYATAGAAGADLQACLPDIWSYRLYPGERLLVPTGLAIELPAGYEGQVRPRSGLAVKHGVTVINAPGTIDSDYRGEIMVGLVNLSNQDFLVTHGMRIAQLVIAPVVQVVFKSTEELTSTIRDAGGFGSTGM